MNRLRGGIAFLALVTLAGTALAQDPSVNESDFNTTTDEPDESYLNESSNSTPSDPTLSENDFDTSVPAADESHLGAEGAGDDGGNDARDTPGPALVGLVSAAVLVVLMLRRK
ncbi:MAG: hypothetical protein WDA16_14895 [Candidatus Thermoplasmatota archaeon]